MPEIVCPHCGTLMQPFELPEAAGWGCGFQLACFNDECAYYRRSWEWMRERFGVRSAYRHRLDPATGASSPLPVWSPMAFKDRILDAEVTVAASPGAGGCPTEPNGGAS
jgi:hypothetical protein